MREYWVYDANAMTQVADAHNAPRNGATNIQMEVTHG